MTFRTLLAALAVAATALAIPAVAQSAVSTPNLSDGSVRTVKALSPEASRALKFTRMPTTQSAPLIFGTYWNCRNNSQGLELCDLVMIVCTNDQSLCFEV